MSMNCFYVLLLISIFFILDVNADGSVYVRFIKFVNPSGEDEDGDDCDFFGSCDHKFHICITPKFEHAKCYTTDRESDEDTNHFGSRIVDIVNPVTGPFKIWRNEFTLRVDVDDYDPHNSNDDVDVLEMSFAPKATVRGTPEESHDVTLHGTSRANTRLDVKYWVICNKNFYKNDCSVECLPQDSDEHGHYNCDKLTGDRICHPFYTKASQCMKKFCQASSNPCKNGGICHNLENGYRCECVGDFEGQTCDKHVDPCLKYRPCLNNATCISLNDGKHRCRCAMGFHGEFCENDVPECDFVPPVCLNGGHCTEEFGSYSCSCSNGYSGQTCEDDVDECQRKPCANGGQCINEIGTFRCQCAAGYKGQTCEQDIDECATANSPICLHNGSCRNQPGGYACECPSEWTGVNCTVDVDECKLPHHHVPCLNRGICENLIGTYQCRCQEGYVGPHCETSVNKCDRLSPGLQCVNGGVCVNTSHASYVCECPSNFTGNYCEKDVDECLHDHQCGHGVCENLRGGYSCRCNEGWSGPMCEKDVNECLHDNGCRHGVCENVRGGYNCRCNAGWSGAMCNMDVNECMLNVSDTSNNVTCLNGGTCENTPGDFHCHCPAGFDGDRCEIGLEVSKVLMNTDTTASAGVGLPVMVVVIVCSAIILFGLVVLFVRCGAHRKINDMMKTFQRNSGTRASVVSFAGRESVQEDPYYDITGYHNSAYDMTTTNENGETAQASHQREQANPGVDTNAPTPTDNHPSLTENYANSAYDFRPDHSTNHVAASRPAVLPVTPITILTTSPTAVQVVTTAISPSTSSPYGNADESPYAEIRNASSMGEPPINSSSPSTNPQPTSNAARDSLASSMYDNFSYDNTVPRRRLDDSLPPVQPGTDEIEATLTFQNSAYDQDPPRN